LEETLQGLAVADWIGRCVLDGKETRRKLLKVSGAARSRGRQRFWRRDTLACAHNRHEKRRSIGMRFAGEAD
jgi:hypothetical protein